jgi:hypothetical protein
MNDKIRELARQAQVGSAEFGNGINYFVSTEETFNRFAELIVRECIDTVQQRCVGDHNREDQEVLRCVADIKQHFGVKE